MLLTPKGYAGLHLGGPHVGRKLHPVEPLDVECGVLEFVDDLLVHLFVGGLDLLAGYGESLDVHFVEFLGQLAEGLVPVLPDLLYDALDGLLDLVRLGHPVLDPVLLVDLLPLLGLDELLVICRFCHNGAYVPLIKIILRA